MNEKSRRGFAAMDADKKRLISSKGGKAAHAKGTAHKFTREEAIAAGRKGGLAAHARDRAPVESVPTAGVYAPPNPVL